MKARVKTQSRQDLGQHLEETDHCDDPNNCSTFPSQNLSIFSKEKRDQGASPSQRLVTVLLHSRENLAFRATT